MSEQAPPGPPEPPGSPGAPVPATATKQKEKSGESHRSFGQILRESILEGNSVTVIVLAIFTAIVIGGLLNAFTNTTVLHAWGNLFSAPGAAISQAWSTARTANRKKPSTATRTTNQIVPPAKIIARRTSAVIVMLEATT